MKKDNKIIVCIAQDDEERLSMVAQLSVKLGFAKTPGDARKIIRQSPHDFDLVSSYFILAKEYNLKSSPLTTHRLYELASRGIAVIIGSRKLPPEYEFCCTPFYVTDFNKL